MESEKIPGKNPMTRNQIRNNYKLLVDEVDPKYVLDLLIQKRVMSIERKDEIMCKATTQNQCRALLDHLLLCTRDDVFVIFRESLQEKYPFIVKQMDSGPITQEARSMIPRPLGLSRQEKQQCRNLVETKSAKKEDLRKKSQGRADQNKIRSRSSESILECTLRQDVNVVAKLQPKSPELESQLDRGSERERHLLQHVCLEDKSKTALVCPDVVIDRPNLFSEEGDIVAEGSLEEFCTAKGFNFNSMIRKQIMSIYTTFVAEIDPICVLDHLIQKGVIGTQRRQKVLSKSTKQCQCRELLDQLQSCSHDQAFVFLRQSLEDHYSWIVERIDAGIVKEVVEQRNDAVVPPIPPKRGTSFNPELSVNEPAIRSNERIQKQIMSNYISFVAEVDPIYPLDHLVQKRVIDLEFKQNVVSKVTKQDQCRALLEYLPTCNSDEAFIVLRESLEDHYPWIVQRIDNSKVEDTVKEGHVAGTPARNIRDVGRHLEGLGKGLYQSETSGRKLSDNENRQTENDLLKQEIVNIKKHLERFESIASVLECALLENTNVVKKLKQKVTEHERQLGKANEGQEYLLQRTSHLEDRLETALAVRDVGLDQLRCDLSHFPRKESIKTSHSPEAACQAGPTLPPPRRSNTVPPSRRTINTYAELDVNGLDTNDESVLFTRPVLSGVIRGGDASICAISVLDDRLYIARFGSTLLEIYDATDDFKRSRKSISISLPGEKAKFGALKRASSARKSVSVSSGIQDIASCSLKKRLYLSDLQNTCIYCVDPTKREVVHSWCVEDYGSLGISTTFEGNVAVCCNGSVCVYSSEGLLLRKIVLKMVEDGPWHAVQMDTDCWVTYHGAQYEGDNCFITAIHWDGYYHEDYPEVEFNGTPSHLALMPSGMAIIVDNETKCVVMIGESFRGEVREILNLEHSSTPVRVHYCANSSRLVVGFLDGTVFIYQFTAS